MMTSRSLAKHIEEVLQLRENLTQVLSLKDCATRIERLQAIVYRDVYDARKEALQGLGEAGPSALPAIRRVMDKPPIPYDPQVLIGAFVKAAGENAGRELNERLQQDLDYWRAVGPSLRLGWWNQDPTPEAPLREKYAETILLVRALAREHYRPAAHTAAELRDYWLSRSQLNDQSGLSQLAWECNELVKHLAEK
jgi:hypothetical protein